MAQVKQVLYDGLTGTQIDELVYLSDSDGAHSLLEDEGKYEAADYVAEKYFN